MGIFKIVLFGKMNFKFLTFHTGMAAARGVSTHVLDTTKGTPGVGIHITLFKQLAGQYPEENKWEMMKSMVTNFDGRTDEPVISEPDFIKLLESGDHFFKLDFDLISYYQDQDVFFPKPELIFKVKQSQRYEHFHVPLLCTPYSFNTYRGS